MIGQTISHYKIVESLGGGGMGVVYKATDLRLNRFVALKFLSSDLTRDRDANLRFRQEAQAASALDHPNICTIHEIDETPSGELFLTMAYYEGETLKARMARGKIDVRDALDWAIQAARGLARAHQSKIVHRDIKPANLILSTDGTLKILDFGLAKLAGQQDVTRTGTVLGTVAYMSPEQARGDLVDARTDVWSLGVVLYEMLAGRRPFDGEGDVATLSSILQGAMAPIGTLRPDTPAALQRIVAKTLERNPEARHANADALLADLEACKAEWSSPAVAGKGLMSPAGKKAMIAAAVIVALSIAIPGYLTYRRVAHERWARNEAMPQIERLIGAGDFLGAMELAKEAGAVLPNDPVLGALWGQFAATATINTAPDGADVYIQPYNAGGDRWEHLGRTPLTDLRLARATYRMRIEKDGYEPLTFAARVPGPPFNVPPARRGVILPAIRLMEKGFAPGMVLVAGGAYPLGLTGFNSDQDIDIAPFLIDRLETTNRAYKAFVESGGYQKLPATLVDSTGKPGPSTWELGDYPAGHAEDPVGGIGWQEAAAYCAFVGKELPTIFHWGRAALSLLEIGQPIAPAVIPASNFSGKSVAPVGTYRGLGPYGTFDMAGNVSEWTWNEAPGDRHWILGGAWNDPDYFFTVPNSRPALDRSPGNGVRCAKYSAELPAAQLARVVTEARDFRTAKAVPDDIYAVYKRLYVPGRAPLNARVDAKNDVNADWSRETLSFDAGYEPGRVTAYLFLPKNFAPPYQLVLYFPGVGPFVSAGSSSTVQGAVVDYVMRGGRAVVVPVFKGSYERWDPFLALVGLDYMQTMRARMGQWHQEVSRTLDMLAERPDIDLSRIAYYGSSFGASTAFPLIALEERFKAAVLAPAGFTYRQMPDEADAVNYAGRVKMPVLMLGGRHDYIFPLETSQKPMYERLGTPQDQKRHVVFETGHGGFPRADQIREVQAWLDKYLGPVTKR